MASAKNVVQYTTLTNKRRDRDDGINGLLVVTNFKLSFLTGKDDQVRSKDFLFLLSHSFYSVQSIFPEYHVPGEFISQLQRCNSTKYRLHIPNY